MTVISMALCGWAFASQGSYEIESSTDGVSIRPTSGEGPAVEVRRLRRHPLYQLGVQADGDGAYEFIIRPRRTVNLGVMAVTKAYATGDRRQMPSFDSISIFPSGTELELDAEGGLQPAGRPLVVIRSRSDGQLDIEVDQDRDGWPEARVTTVLAW